MNEAQANDEPAIAEVIAAEQAWLQAHVHNDVAHLDRLMAAEYVQITDSGGMRTKADAIASFAAGRRHWTHAASDEYRIQIYGHAAVVIGRWRAAGINDGHAFEYAARYISLWVRRDDRWQIVTDQSTTIRD